MTRLRRRPWLRRRRPRTRGQALVELGIVLPFLVVLLAGSAQVGTIAYAQVTIDTATREGARVASENPVNALNFGGASQTFSCANAGTNAAVEAVCNASGLLDDTKLSIVITRNIDPSSYRPPADVVLVRKTCRGNEALVTGSVSGIPSGLTASVQSSGGGSLTQVGSIPSPGGSYTLCLTPGTQTVSATVGNGCTGYSASASQSFTSGSTYTIDLAVQPNPTCPPTPTPTPSSTPTPTATPAPSGTPGPTPAGSPTCSPPPGSTTQYVSVAVSYTVPVFVPFVNTILANGPNGRTITGSLTVRIEPCTINQGR